MEAKTAEESPENRLRRSMGRERNKQGERNKRERLELDKRRKKQIEIGKIKRERNFKVYVSFMILSLKNK